MTTCYLCAMLCKRTTQMHLPIGVYAIENGSSLIMEQSTRRALLRIYGGHRNGSETTPSSVNSPLVRGYAVETKSLDFGQLRLWLNDCNEHHKCMQSSQDNGSSPIKLPTRLLRVDPSQNTEDIRLEVTKNVMGNRYLALSHCWGEQGTQNMDWRTLSTNIGPRMEAFKLWELPKTLQDAVIVTRELGLSYIWIDSLCIVQDDLNDWKQESKRMEDVYAFAYCTIAATSALDSSAGFLEGMADNESLYVDDGKGSTLYISTNVANFDIDTNGPGLNQRAWVMQERFLSPRTIHFTKTQVYGECGNGIFAGDGIFLRSNENTKKSFAHDPHFPGRLRSSGFAATLEFIQSLMENYSKRGITKSSDRAIAISGLMNRIAKAIPCPIHHGIVKWYLHRTLLWRRGPGQNTERINYQAPGQAIPSWSWMVYPGTVEFQHDGFGKMGRLRDLEFVEKAVRTKIWGLGCSNASIVKVPDNEAPYQLQSQDGSKKGRIWLDVGIEPPPLLDVAVLAKYPNEQVDGLKYLAILVKWSQLLDGYERVGIGILHKDCVLENGRIGEIF